MVDLAATAKDTFGIGGINMSAGSIGQVMMIIVIVLVIFGLIGWLVYWKKQQQAFKYKIHVYKKVGNTPTRIGYYKAREVAMGRAGDYLWLVKGINKYLPVPILQSAPNEYWFWIREDGEWINFSLEDLDESSKKAGVKYLHQDMRMQRLATDRLLEQRLMKKSFWEQYGMIIAYVVFFLVLSIAMVVIFYQYGEVVDKTGFLVDRVGALMDKANGPASAELIPAALGFLFPINWFRKKKEYNPRIVKECMNCLKHGKDVSAAQRSLLLGGHCTHKDNKEIEKIYNSVKKELEGGKNGTK